MLRRRLSQVKRRLSKKLEENPRVSLKAGDRAAAAAGSLLLSYVIEPFLLRPGESVSNAHSNHWEALQIAKTFLSLGYSVDVIKWDDEEFRPIRPYSYCIDIHSNLERIAPLLNRDCVKILHITGAHWLFQNQAEYTRLLALQRRRAITLCPRRIVPPSLGIEHADYATIWGNQFTIGTFQFAEKSIYRLPVPATAVYPRPDDKNYEACRKKFLWLGSGGMVHKGLDLVLEAFAQMPEYQLTVCGPVSDEKDFAAAYEKELYRTPNIRTLGWIDTSSAQFLEVAGQCLGLIYPSCSEGSAGSVVTCLHAGLIPIVSYESGIDVDDFGVILHSSSVEEIKESLAKIASLPADELRQKSHGAWDYARAFHTRDNYAKEYRNFVVNVLGVREAE